MPYLALVKTNQNNMKPQFNKSEILKKAWALVKRGWNLSVAMKAAWQWARNGASLYKGDSERIFITYKRNADKLASLQATLGRGAAL